MDIKTCESLEYSKKENTLQEWLGKYKHLPAQRSDQWKADRTFSIGASEINVLLGTDPFKTIRGLIASKVGLDHITDKTAMNWGVVMEHVVLQYTEIVMGCKIYEAGAIPTAGMRGQRSSPDGVAVVRCLGNVIVSFEFKAPKKRIPNGKMPHYYKSQVLTCLCAVEPSELGIFVDMAIRRCSAAAWSFGTKEYDTTYHKYAGLDGPHGLMVLFFYPVNTHESDVTAASEAEPANPIDLGACEPSVLDDFLSRAADLHTLRVEYGRMYTDTSQTPKLADELAEHKTAIGFLPIKVMRCNILPVEKEPEYALQFQPQIDRIIDVIRTIMDAPVETRRQVFERECNARGWT